MEGGWREADNGTESSSRWAGGEEQQLDGGAAYEWARDSLAVYSSAETTSSAHQGDGTGVGISAKEKKERRYVRDISSMKHT